MKNIRVISENIDNILIVDYDPENLAPQLNNSIPILRFSGKSLHSDTELLRLEEYLRALSTESPTHIVMSNRDHFMFFSLKSAKNMQNAYSTLFSNRIATEGIEHLDNINQ